MIEFDKIDYLKQEKEIDKYDYVISKVVYGKHKKNPFFSIMIPTYHRPELLKQALFSALYQKGFTNYEIVICDNDPCEENESLRMVKKIADDRIVYYKNSENIGAVGNGIRAYDLAKGKWVVLLDDDDYINENYLSIVYRVIKKNKIYGLIGVDVSTFMGNKEPVFQKIDKFPNVFNITYTEFFLGTVLTSSGMTMPNGMFRELLGTLIPMGDHILQYKAIKNYELVKIDANLFAYRFSKNSFTANPQALADMVCAMYYFKKQIRNENFAITVFCKFFWNEYMVEYIMKTLGAWNNKHAVNKILKRIDDNLTMDIRKVKVMNYLLKCIHKGYDIKHSICNRK